MKIIHVADIHLDSKMESNLSIEKARERRSEIKQTFVKLVEYAKINNVSIIIIAGDLFDSIETSERTKNFVLNLIKENTNISFVFLRGNHDFGIFFNDEKVPTNLFELDDNWKYFNFEDVTITGVTLQETYNENIYDSLSLDKSRKNIVVLHGQITKGSIDYISYGINLNLLKNKNIDYLALGHIHEYEKGTLDERGIYAYSGALEGRGFDECGEKGFILIDTNDFKKSKFIPFSNRKFYEIKVNVSNCQNIHQILENIKEATEEITNENLIKVVLIGELEETFEKDLDYLSNSLNEIFFFTKIVDKTKLKINLDNLKADISLKGEFIREVLDASDINEEDKNNIILYGIKALEGDEF